MEQCSVKQVCAKVNFAQGLSPWNQKLDFKAKFLGRVNLVENVVEVDQKWLHIWPFGMQPMNLNTAFVSSIRIM